MIYAIIIFILTIAVKLAFDVRLYFSSKPNKHITGPIIVVVLLSICTWFCGWLSAPMWFFNYWVIFDILYAVLIGQKPFYIGTTARLDILQRKYPVITWLKYGGAVASIIIYIIL